MFLASKPKIRTVTVKKAPPATTADAPRKTTGTSSNGRPRTSAVPPTDRYKLTPSAKVRRDVSGGSRPTAGKPVQTARGSVRKRKVTPSTPQWASSSDESSEDEEQDRLGNGLRKRQKLSSSIEPIAANRCLEPDLKRRIRIRKDGKRVEAETGRSKDDQEERLIEGVEMTRGQWAKDFKPAFPGTEKNIVVELQYPSSSRPEKFEIVVPRDTENYNFNPLGDIYYSIEEILLHYLPEDISTELQSEVTGTVRLLKRAVAKNAPDDFKAVLWDFNKTMKASVADGTVNKILDDMHAIPLSLTKCILTQVYQRTVSPHAHLLRRVKDRETTYGELLPSFVHTIFHQTGLNSSSVFIDLGSGVGNVVLQSALQTGAESWGIEILDTPAQYAREQASELRARARQWNISLGSMHLLHGSFLDSPEVDAVLQRADVVLVNNKVFEKETNASLLNKFLDLKLGCRVVSLESFGGNVKGSKQGGRNENSIASLFDEERFESGTRSVSWTDESVEYYIATKAR